MTKCYLLRALAKLQCRGYATMNEFTSHKQQKRKKKSNLSFGEEWSWQKEGDVASQCAAGFMYATPTDKHLHGVKYLIGAESSVTNSRLADAQFSSLPFFWRTIMLSHSLCITHRLKSVPLVIMNCKSHRWEYLAPVWHSCVITREGKIGWDKQKVFLSIGYVTLECLEQRFLSTLLENLWLFQ